MQVNTPDIPAGHFSSKPLWGAITVLGVAVIALGASLIHVQTRPVDGHAVFAIADTPAVPTATQQASPGSALPVTAVAADEAVLAPEPAIAASTPTTKNATEQSKPRPVPAAAPAVRATVPVAAPVAMPTIAYPPAIATAPAPAPVPAPYVVTESGPIASVSVPQAAPGTRAICTTCGRVVSVTQVQRMGEANGVGAIAGGVLGAVVGNQVGGGNGRAIATILGAVGGGVAGNAIERNMQTVTVYLVQVRMDDGSVRSFEQASPLAPGTAVFVQGQSLRMANGAAAPALEIRDGATRLPAQPQARIYSTDRN